MNCLSDGALRSRIDGEPDAEEASLIDAHLGGCKSCTERADKIRAETGDVQKVLAVLEPAKHQVPAGAAQAYARFREQFFSSRHVSGPLPRTLISSWKKAIGGALAAGVVVALLIGFAPASSWGQRILAMLRVQKLAILPIDLSAMETDSHGDRSAGKLLTQMISDTVVVTSKPGEPQTAHDAESASRIAGFPVRTLDALGSPQKISVHGEAAFHTTLDRERIQDLLDQAGRSDIHIPSSADGSTIAVHIGKVVWEGYGSCPTSRKSPRSDAQPEADSTARRKETGATGSGNCISFVQAPSPVVTVPPTLNVSELAEAGLEVAGMNPADAHAFCQTIDWSSTLVIPVPERGSSYRTVAVDGVNGELVETAAHGKSPAQYALLWVKNGMVYSLGGTGDSNEALAAAASLD